MTAYEGRPRYRFELEIDGERLDLKDPPTAITAVEEGVNALRASLTSAGSVQARIVAVDTETGVKRGLSNAASHLVASRANGGDQPIRSASYVPQALFDKTPAQVFRSSC